MDSQLCEDLWLGNSLKFEAKYIYQMLSAVLVTFLRVQQAIDVVNPYATSYRQRHGGSNSSTRKIRNKLWKNIFDDFVYNFSYNCLKQLTIDSKQPRISNWMVQLRGHSSPTIVAVEGNTAVRDIIFARRPNIWPVKQYRVKEF